MEDFLENIKRDLDKLSDEDVMITLTRKDVEMLVNSYEKVKILRRLADERKDVIERLSKL